METIKTFIDSWRGSRKWSLHLMAMGLLTYVFKTSDGSFDTYAYTLAGLAASFGITNAAAHFAK